MKYSLNRGIEK